MYHLDAQIQTALARERALTLRSTMSARRRLAGAPKQGGRSTAGAPASLWRRVGAVGRAAV